MGAARGAAALLVALFVARALAAPPEKPYDLATFPRGGDQIVDRCHALTEALADKAAATCGHRRGDPNHPWLCPAGEPQRVAALDRCRSLAPTAKDQPAMLYLLGLAYLDLASIPDGDRCPRHFYYQEGSSVCVYTDVHFKRLMAKYPRSEYADMAAAKVAQHAYRYYECEGGVVCAVENGVAGWVPFLEQRPESRYAPVAVHHVVEAVGRLSDPRGMTFNGYDKTLREDFRRLDAAANRLPPDLRTALKQAVAKARAEAERLERERSGSERR